jgi:hypothetical protein
MTIVDGPNQIGAIDRPRLALFADVLIAGGAGLPPASGVDPDGAWIDRVFAVREDLVAIVADVVAIEGDPQTVLDALKLQDPLAFDSFTFAISGAYLINPRIRKLLGFPGAIPEANPAYPDEAESYLEDGILDDVIQRGPIYRPTPTRE